MLLIIFCTYCWSFVGQIPHYLHSDSNTMNLSRIRRCMIEPEEIWSKNTEEKESSVKILQGCENSQPANFTSCEISQHCSPAPAVDCFLTHFLFGFVQIFPRCNFGSFVHSCNFLFTEHLYKLSQACYFNQSFSPSINKENWAQSFLSLDWFCDFLSFSFIFLHFLSSQTPLDDDKSRDVRLKPHHR